jgi:SAM-dependent methyltransferase
MNSEAIYLLRCPTCQGPLESGQNELSCPTCTQSYPVTKSVVRFLPVADEFYEGAYNRQVHHIPTERFSFKNWAFFNLAQSGVFGELQKYVVPGCWVLDIGCAGGIRWLGKVANTIGMDLSFSSLEVAAETYGLAVQGDVSQIPLANHSLDIVYGSYFFEHLDGGLKDRCLSQMRRCLKPGGIGILQFDVLSANALTRWALQDQQAFKKGFIDGDGHIGLEPLPDALSRMKSAGFSVINVRKFGTTLLQYMPTYVWLKKGYGDQVNWARWLGRAAETVQKSKVGLPVELAITAFDQAINNFTAAEDATRAIVTVQAPQ